MQKAVNLLVRRDDMTHEEFVEYWLDEHADLAAGLPGLKGYRTSVPTDPETADATLTATPVGATEYRLSPYPFRDSPVVVNVPSRTVKRASFEDEKTLLRRYYGADTTDLRVTLRPE